MLHTQLKKKKKKIYFYFSSVSSCYDIIPKLALQDRRYGPWDHGKGF